MRWCGRTMTGDLADTHYAEHVDKAFLPAAQGVHDRRPAGRVRPQQQPGDRGGARSRRRDRRSGGRGWNNAGELRCGTGNLVHTSDGPDSAKQELSLWFPELV